VALTDMAIRSAKAQERSFKLFDSGGLYVTLGVYPDVSLKAARVKRDDMRRELAAGIDPGQARKARQVSLAGG
jgi:hypothetical protein